MTRNMGIADRLVRLVLAALILGLYGVLPSPWKYFTLIGLVPLGTALVGNCPLYTLKGWSTVPRRTTESR